MIRSYLKGAKHRVEKGFTLIELLIVIAILAILVTITVLILNPAELTARGRDVQRFADHDSLRSAIALYLNEAGCKAVAPWSTGTTHASNVGTRAVDGTGWIPLNLNAITGGSPLASLPVDPTNTGTLIYQFRGDDTTGTRTTVGVPCGFEINALTVESKQFTTAPNNKGADDGGNSATKYETGTDPGLDLLT